MCTAPAGVIRNESRKGIAPWVRRSRYSAQLKCQLFGSAARIFLPAFPWSSVGRVARWAAGMPFSLSHCPRALGFGVGVMWRLQNCLPCLRGGSREDTGGSVSGAFLGSVRDVYLVTAIRICLLGLLIPALTGAKVRITPWVRILCDACSRRHIWRLISRGVQRRLFGWSQ